jgi:hypothetical protein
MKGGALRTRGIVALLAAVATLLLVAGCGGSSSGGDTVTVQAGSLSKDQFIERADAICEATRNEIVAKYSGFWQKNKSSIGNPDKEEALFPDFLESVLAPGIEKEIKQISEIGAPKAYKAEVTAVLTAFQEKLDEVRADPTILKQELYPFQKAATAAERAGMTGCSRT